jgi:cytochrome c biogenesis protein CcdA
MWELFKSYLTTTSAQWYETLPFVVGIGFVIVEIVVRLARDIRPVFSAPALGYMLSEGITVCIMPMYGIALAFDHALAVSIAEKNSKVLVVAMFVAFATLTIHIFEGWFGAKDAHV